MKKILMIAIGITALTFLGCGVFDSESEKETQLNERKLEIDTITNQAIAIFSKFNTDIDNYRLDMNKDSIQNTLFECLADSVELGLAFAEKIRDEISLKVDSVKRLDKLNAEKEKASREKEDKLAVKNLKSKVNKLFNSLMSFKTSYEFRDCGFGIGCKYNDWLLEVQSLKSVKGSDLFLSECGFVIGELEMLGLEYASSKGNETDYSRYTSKMIRDGLKGIKSY